MFKFRRKKIFVVNESENDTSYIWEPSNLLTACVVYEIEGTDTTEAWKAHAISKI